MRSKQKTLPAEVRILAVIGLHQDPDYWLHRLAD